MSHDLLIIIGQSRSSSDLQPADIVTFSPLPVYAPRRRVAGCVTRISEHLACGGGGLGLASNNDRGALRATSPPLMSACYP